MKNNGLPCKMENNGRAGATKNRNKRSIDAADLDRSKSVLKHRKKLQKTTQKNNLVVDGEKSTMSKRSKNSVSFDGVSLVESNERSKNYQNLLYGFCKNTYQLMEEEMFQPHGLVGLKSLSENADSEIGDQKCNFNDQKALSFLAAVATFCANETVAEFLEAKNCDDVGARHETSDKKNVTSKTKNDFGQIIKTESSNICKMLKILQSKQSKVLQNCKEIKKCILEFEKEREHWEIWKMQYASEIRTNYDPTLGGGVSKPTLEILSIQSTLSKTAASDDDDNDEDKSKTKEKTTSSAKNMRKSLQTARRQNEEIFQNLVDAVDRTSEPTENSNSKNIKMDDGKPESPILTLNAKWSFWCDSPTLEESGWASKTATKHTIN